MWGMLKIGCMFNGINVCVLPLRMKCKGGERAIKFNDELFILHGINISSKFPYWLYCGTSHIHIAEAAKKIL